MAAQKNSGCRRWARCGSLLAFVLFLAACGKPVGLIYTHITLPLTADLNNTPVPANPPQSGKTIEIKEPITRLGMYAQVNSNALGEVARQNGMQTLYFADRQVFSILGIWTTVRSILYGE